jgi:hypothetical protein
MRGSLVLLAAVLGCSDAGGPPRFLPVLTTQISAATDTVNGVLAVTLTASNPTDTTERMPYEVPTVSAEFDIDADWRGGYGPAGFTTTDSLVLDPGASATVGTVSVSFTPTAALSGASFDNESISLPPGTYSVRACVSVGQSVCGNGVPFTLTQ